MEGTIETYIVEVDTANKNQDMSKADVKGGDSREARSEFDNDVAGRQKLRIEQASHDHCTGSDYGLMVYFKGSNILS